MSRHTILSKSSGSSSPDSHNNVSGEPGAIQCDDEGEFKRQEFHSANPKVFGDYTGLEDFVPLRLYEREFLDRYWEHCRLKALAKIGPKTIEELSVPNSDVRKNMTKLERYINIARHTQHHAGQLALTLQLIDGTETQWISWGGERL
jgi:hypothetical protein